MQLEDLKIEYDKLQQKYGAKELDSIYNGGCEENPDICFVFMNPTGRNIASSKEWRGLKSPWSRKRVFEKEINSKKYKFYPVYYPVGNGSFNVDKSIEDINWIMKKELQ